MKKIYLLIILCFLCFSCERDEVMGTSPLMQNPKRPSIEFMDLVEVPQDVLNLFHLNKGALATSNSFGSISENAKISKISDSKGKASYTFLLHRESSKTKHEEYYFDNLVITEGENARALIFRYKPCLGWVKKGRDFNSFTGTITIFEPNGKRIAIINTDNGQQINKRNFSGKTVCHYELEKVETWCFGDLCTTTYYYIETCTSGGPGLGDKDGSEGDGPGDPASIPTIPIDGDDQDWDYGSGGGGQGGVDNPPMPVPEPLEIIVELGEKAECIYNKLNQSSTSFAEAIKKFDGEFPVSHLKLSTSNSLPADIYGVTYPPEDYITEIVFNENRLGNLSDLGKATTMAHEIIHAEIFRKLLSAAQQGDLNHNQYTTANRTSYVHSLRNNFPGLYDYYWERFHPSWNHNMMAGHYRSVIADMLQEFDNNRLSQTEYEAIAWAGLGKFEAGNSTIAWSQLTDKEKQSIEDIIDQHFFNGPSNCN